MKINNKNRLILIAIISIIIIMLIIIVTIMSINNKNNNSEAENNQNSISENAELSEEDKELIAKLKTVSESERIRIYLGRYFKYIENKDYDSAYNLLYPEFKEKYFPTVDDYKSYIEEQEFPDLLTIEYDDIHTRGEYYIVTVIISDFIPQSETLQKEKTFVIKENGYNDYYISLKK